MMTRVISIKQKEGWDCEGEKDKRKIGGWEVEVDIDK